MSRKNLDPLPTCLTNSITKSMCCVKLSKTCIVYLILAVLTLISVHGARGQDSSDLDEGIYQYTRAPVPDEFVLGQRYPNRNEEDVCRPIRLRITRNSHLFRTNLITNNHPHIAFTNSDARVMISRLQTRLNDLATVYFNEYSARISVLKAWIEYSEDGNGIDDPYSLHYEGRTVSVSVPRQHISSFLKLAVDAGFDWVYYASYDYVRLSVIPDVCDANLDLVFLLDQSGSVGPSNHYIALNFLEEVVNFYDISPNATQVGLVTFSSGARVEFRLNEHTDITSLQTAFSEVTYSGGWTTTALALLLAQLMLNPSRGYGARPSSSGIPKIAVLVTDGRSNIYPLNDIATHLRNFGVQVYAVGIGNVYLEELKFIASDPDPLHVFVLNSFNDAPHFVDFLSFTACDTPAIVEPGKNTTSVVDEDGFRFFQSECQAFSVTIMIEQIDVIGTCSLYASTVLQNPGPLDPSGITVKNEDSKIRKRSVHLNLSNQNRFVYWSVKGVDVHNQFTVIIWDMIFPEDVYTVYVQEEVSNELVFSLNDALKMTNVTFNYTIESGDDLGNFAINPLTGEVVTTVPLDVGVQDSFMLTIVAQNSQYSCHRGRVMIRVIVIGNRVIFPPLFPVFIAENSTPGTSITQVQVSGADSFIRYSIVSGNVGNAFMINGTSGVIEVLSPLDFEMVSMYSLSIQATSARTGNIGFGLQSVTVQNVNEQPFFITPCAIANLCEFTIEDLAKNTVVGSITVNDPDRSSTPDGMIDFVIEGDNHFIIMQIGMAANIQTNSTLPGSVTSYVFSVVASDRGSPPLTVVTTVTVAIDVNSNAPVFSVAPEVLHVLESTTADSNITQFVATDADQGTNGDVVYSVSSLESTNPFTIDPSSGVLFVSGPLDFEQMSSYRLIINASNPDSMQSSSVHTVVLVIDVNDNPPVFTQDAYNGSVNEHATSGQILFDIQVTDADSGSNAEVDFEIVSGNVNGLLSLAPFSTLGAFLTVSGSGDINRDVVQVFTLNVRATDRGLPQFSNLAQVVVTVTDVNDNPPNFLPDSYSVSIREDAVPPFNFLSVFVFDIDQPFTPNTEVDFGIVKGNIGNVFSVEKVDDNTATLSLIGQLDSEVQSTYELVLTAIDRGTNPGPQTSTATVSISVIDVNVFPPNVTGNQTIAVLESEQVGTEIAQIDAVDPDSNEITFEIVSVQGEGVSGEAAMGVFSVNNEGTVSLAELLDFETSSRYEIEISVTDGTLTTTTRLVVIVINVNEVGPVLTTTSFLVTEEQPRGTVVGTVVATDLDAGDSETVTFSIITNGRVSNLFRIDEGTGIIQTRQVLDRESLVLAGLFLPARSSNESLTIQAVDEGTPRLTSRTEVTITLLDINDNAPVFESVSNNTVGAVFENENASTVIVDAVAIDGDLGVSGTVVYSLDVLNSPSGVSPPFEITNQGLVITTMRLDREEQDVYSVVIQATDNGMLPMTAVVMLSIRILDRNDNVPVFLQSPYSISVLETISVPTQLLQVSAVDADEGKDGDVVYSIVTAQPSSSSTMFSINNQTGEISLDSELDFETSAAHTLTIRAQDRGTPSMSSSTQVDITVENVDEIPPSFIGPCSVAVRESVSPNTPITLCIATDIDDTTSISGIAVRYEFLQGNVGGAFSISNDGTVRVAKNVDRETIDFYEIIVQATDRAGLSTTAILAITIDDVNDNPPIISNLPANRTISVANIRSDMRGMITVAATDSDIGLNAELVFSLREVRQLPGDKVTEVVVEVADRSRSPLVTSETVTFFFEESCTLQQYSIGSTSGLISVDLVCSVDVLPSAAAVTIGNSLLLLCPVLRNIPIMYSWFVNGTLIRGPLGLNESSPAPQLLIQSATFQDAGQYTCRVGSEIGNILSFVTTVRVQVPPTITIPPMSVTIEAGRIVTFRCFATGVPSPTITWSRQNADGSVQVLTITDRILPIGNFLTIANIDPNDQGMYMCTASNGAGQITANANLGLFGRSNVVTVQMVDYLMSSKVQACHEFNINKFEGIMSDITGLSTIVTQQAGDDVCNHTACSPSPCLNGGSCNLNPDDLSGLGYVCTCPQAYAGINCDSDINECDMSPCLFGGVCTNEDGFFFCSCPLGTTGSRCQYTAVCDSQPCLSNQMCIATVANMQGYVCGNTSGTGLVVMIGDEDTNPGLLDDQVNSLLELQEETGSVTRKKRQLSDTAIENNSFVTTCEARFVLRSEMGDYILMWACPKGVKSPSANELDEICRTLFSSGLVDSCDSPTGLSLNNHLKDQLPPTTIYISFVMMSGGGSLLSGGEALSVLAERAALEKLRAQGYQATNFSIVEQPTPLCFSGNLAAAVVVAVIVTVTTASLIFIAIFVARRRKPKKTITVFDNTVSLQTVYSINSDPCYDDYVDRAYSNLNHPPTCERTFTYGTSVNKMPEVTYLTREPDKLFDNEIYGKGYIQPSASKSQVHSDIDTCNVGLGKRHGSTLRRSSAVRGRIPSLTKRTQSQHNLLDAGDSGDYDRLEICGPTVTMRTDSDSQPAVETNPDKSSGDYDTLEKYSSSLANKSSKQTQSQCDDDEIIYGNLPYIRTGGLGNAGERWESYWKTRTLLRSVDQSQNTAKDKAVSKYTS